MDVVDATAVERSAVLDEILDENTLKILLD